MYRIKISTKRFIIRTLNLKDINQTYLSWFTKKENYKYLNTIKKKQTLQSLKNFFLKKKKKKIFFCGIFLKKNNLHVGNIKFEPVNFNKKSTTLGIFIGNPEWRGKSCGYECLRKIINFINKKYSLNYFYLGVDKKNTRATKLYTKLGFIKYEINKNSYKMVLKLI